ncbi:hypothetical protein X975_06889, partial [Stegodyphus mimosarum]
MKPSNSGYSFGFRRFLLLHKMALSGLLSPWPRGRSSKLIFLFLLLTR